MNYKRILFAFLLVALTILLILSIRTRTKVAHKMPVVNMAADVSSVMRGFDFKEKDGDVSIDIKGKEAVLRGRKVMVFRSNLTKTTFFKEIKGSIVSNKRIIVFAADTGEWDTTKKSPLMMTGNIYLKLDSRVFSGVETLGIHFNRHEIEVDKVLYSF